MANGTKISDLDTLDKTGYGKYLDDKGTSVNDSDRVLKSGDVIDLYGKVTLNGKDQYGKIGSAVALDGNYYTTDNTKYVSVKDVKFGVQDLVINDGYYKVDVYNNTETVDEKATGYYKAGDVTFNVGNGTGFIVSTDGGKTYQYQAGTTNATVTVKDSDLIVKKGYVKVDYTTSGETKNGYKWTIEPGNAYAKAGYTLDVKYTVSNDNMQSGDAITVTFGGVTGTDKFYPNGTSMSRTAPGLQVGTTDITVTISNISK